MKTFSEFIIEARRIRVLNTKHYTSASNRESILKSGYKNSPSTGTYHPDDQKGVVYSAPSSRVGSDYGSHVVHHTLINPKIHHTDSPRDFGKKIKKWVASSSQEDLVSNKGKPTSAVDQAKSAFRQGAKVVRVPDAHGEFTPKPGQAQGSYVMMSQDVANRSINRNPTPTIKARNKSKRTKIRTKK